MHRISLSHHVLKIKDLFEELSGLEIYFSKTKAIWIRSERYRDDGIFHDIIGRLSLWHLVSNMMYICNLQGIAEQNCEDKMAEIDKLLHGWSRRNITLTQALHVKSIFFIFYLSRPKLSPLIHCLHLPHSTKNSSPPFSIISLTHFS